MHLPPVTTAVRPYRERGTTGLTRDQAAIWHQPPPRPEPPPLPSGPYCPACRYRGDAPGHRYLCAPPPPHP